MNDINEHQEKGLLAWFAQNHVAANLVMIMILVAGALNLLSNKVEIFPDFSVDVITITVPYLGATPEEAEQGVCLRVEQAVSGLEGIKRLRSVGMEGAGMTMIEVDTYADTQKLLDDIKAEVDRITTFPKETERPEIVEWTMKSHVISLVLYGDVPEATLKELAQFVRDDLTALPEISQVDLAGVRDYEISIEISEETLRRYGLSFDEVSQAVAGASLDLPGGSVKTQGGEILIRTQSQRYRGHDFEDVVIRTRTDGTQIRLSDIATVIDDFEDSDLASYFDGQRAVHLQVYRIGEQNILDVVGACMTYLHENQNTLPEGVKFSTWFDRSQMLRSRIQLLLKNAAFGLVFVFLVLAFFLDLRLAFWTTLGIPISFMGAFWVMPTDLVDTSINMMSLFGFILALGIVVDDAIVVGENVFAYRQKGLSPTAAAIKGVREMAAPVTMAVLTTIFSFVPLLCIAGVWGKFIRVIPTVVISVLAFSLVEALLILPAHLSGGRPVRRGGAIGRFQEKIRIGLDGFINNRFEPFVRRAVSWRYVTVAISIAVLMMTVGYVQGGFIKFSLMPDVEADNVWVSLAMPQGTSVEQTRAVVKEIEAAAERVRQRFDGERQAAAREGETPPSLFKHMSTNIGEQPFTRGDAGGPPTSSDSGSHAAEINIELIPGEDRSKDHSSQRIGQLWREEIGEIPGVASLTITSSLFHGGDAVYVEMSHYDFDQLLAAVEDLKTKLAEYDGVIDIADTFEAGKMELKLHLKERGRLLGLTEAGLARQVRQGFYGDEVQRVQRGRDDVRVMVRYPQDQRRSMADIENMRLRLHDGTEVPFGEVAQVELGRGYATIDRADQRRIVSVTANVDQTITTGNEVNASLQGEYLSALQDKYPGLVIGFQGEQRDQQEIMGSLASSGLVSLLAIFGLLAVQFRSYLQPTIIMSVIPFGLVGAIIGHVVMGFNLSILSIFGIVALTGVVVNDSLIMIDLINRERKSGIALKQVISDSVTRRFRPIMLTTATTFCGLVPMMLEQSLQARFLIPMAVSLAFGVLFATCLTLILVPSLYMILEDLAGKGAGLDEESPH